MYAVSALPRQLSEKNWPMNSIAASVIGGVSLTGGVGNPAGADRCGSHYDHPEYHRTVRCKFLLAVSGQRYRRSSCHFLQLYL